MITYTTTILYNQNIIGTCSICKGAVTVPTMWHGVIPPTPTCSSCGAVAAPNYGPEIEMVPMKSQVSSTDTIKMDWDNLTHKTDIKFKYDLDSNSARTPTWGKTISIF